MNLKLEPINRDSEGNDDTIILALCAWILILAMICSGCGETGLPDFGAEGRPASSYFPKHIPINYGPRANECPERQASGEIEGLAVKLVGDEYIVTWASEPKTNDISPMRAVLIGSAKIHLAYPDTGMQEVYSTAEVEVEIEPGQSRLLSGTIIVPVRNVAPAARAYAPKMLFDALTVATRMDGIVFKGDGLTFDYMGTKDGFASARWTAKTNRVTHKITARCDNGPEAVLDTATYVAKATCTLIDKDGKEVAKDVVTPTDAAGRCEAVGFIRLPSEVWRTIDWRRCTVRWDWTAPPAEKPAAQGKVRTMKVTAYCPCSECCGNDAEGITATGNNAYKDDRGVASAFACLPPGTLVVVPGYGMAIVDDTGSAMRKAWRDRREFCIDLRMPTHHQARAWGVRYLPVVILEG